MAVQQQIRFEELEPGQTESRWLAEAKRLYVKLFDGFELSPTDIEGMIASPTMLSVLILRATKTDEELVGFYCGTPLRNLELISPKIRRLLGLLTPRAYFLMALGLETRGSGLASGALWWTYRDLLTRVHEAGYRSIYLLARCGADDSRVVDQGSQVAKSPSLDKHLHRFGAARIWKPIELAPGHLFRPMRIGRLKRKVAVVDGHLGHGQGRGER